MRRQLHGVASEQLALWRASNRLAHQQANLASFYHTGTDVTSLLARKGAFQPGGGGGSGD